MLDSVSTTVAHRSRRSQPCFASSLAIIAAVLVGNTLLQSSARAADPATSEKEMKPYVERLADTEVAIEMVPIPGGTFLMGSPPDEKNRKPDEGPQHKVKVEPFWMGKYEITWDQYDVWSFNLDIQRRKLTKSPATDRDKIADAITRPTKPYTDMTFNSGHDGYPAICMTQVAAKMYCQWLTAKTGHFYRLPTEAEWEYACRAGTTTAFSFGDDVSKLDDYGWHYDNAGDDRDANYHKVGQKKPNPWGLYDMHGNVSEWVLDAYSADFYTQFKDVEVAEFPLNIPTTLYPRVVRGGSWYDDPEDLRSARRFASSSDWKIQDPQLPQSIWYHTDALHVGFRVIRPLVEPSEEVKKKLHLIPLPPDLVRR